MNIIIRVVSNYFDFASVLIEEQVWRPASISPCYLLLRNQVSACVSGRKNQTNMN